MKDIYLLLRRPIETHVMLWSDWLVYKLSLCSERGREAQYRTHIERGVGKAPKCSRLKAIALEGYLCGWTPASISEIDFLGADYLQLTKWFLIGEGFRNKGFNRHRSEQIFWEAYWIPERPYWEFRNKHIGTREEIEIYSRLLNWDCSTQSYSYP